MICGALTTGNCYSNAHPFDSCRRIQVQAHGQKQIRGTYFCNTVLDLSLTRLTKETSLSRPWKYKSVDGIARILAIMNSSGKELWQAYGIKLDSCQGEYSSW